MTDERRAQRALAHLAALTPPTTSAAPPSLEALRYGARFVWDNPFADTAQWANALVAETAVPLLPEARACLLAVANAPATPASVVALAEACERVAADESLGWPLRDRAQEIGSRARFAAAFLGDFESACIAMQMCDAAANLAPDDAETRLLLVTRGELSSLASSIRLGTFEVGDFGKRNRRRFAWIDLKSEAETVQFWESLGLEAKEDRSLSGKLLGPVRDDTGMDPRDPNHPDYVPDEPIEPVAPASGVIVFPPDIEDRCGKQNAIELRRFVGPHLGARLPLVPVPEDWGAWEVALVAEAPWLAPLVRAVRASQGGRKYWGGGVVCVEGPLGSGKSRMARRIAEVSGLPYARFQVDSTADNSGLAGTPIRWSSGHPGVSERLLAQAGRASGLVTLDEIEKAAGSRRNGSGEPHDVMHSLFERESAQAWRSPFLMGEVDLSHVFYIATANETGSLPASLRDRMRIVRVGEPGPEHLGTLAPALARAVCAELGLDERWGALDGEEIAALAEAWEGGSVRRLQKLVEGILEARDGAPVARH